MRFNTEARVIKKKNIGARSWSEFFLFSNSNWWEEWLLMEREHIPVSRRSGEQVRTRVKKVSLNRSCDIFNNIRPMTGLTYFFLPSFTEKGKNNLPIYSSQLHQTKREKGEEGKREKQRYVCTRWTPSLFASTSSSNGYPSDYSLSVDVAATPTFA